MGNVYLANTNDGFWTTGSNWNLVDTKSYNNTENTTTNLNTTFQNSNNWGYTGSAPTVNGMAVKIQANTVTPASSLFVVSLYNSTDALSVAEVTTSFNHIAKNGWQYFPFDTPVALTTGKSYVARAKIGPGTAGTINLHRGAGGTDFARLIDTNTNGTAPAASDFVFILGPTTISASNTTNVFYDETSDIVETNAIKIGIGNITSGSLVIGRGGILTFGTGSSESATAYKLKMRGLIEVSDGGKLLCENIPSGYSVDFDFNCEAAGNYGLKLLNYSTCSFIGSEKTPWSLVSGSNALSGANYFTCSNKNGWLTGDTLYLLSTSTTYLDNELVTLNNTSALDNGIDLTDNLTKTHSGSSPLGTPYDGEVMNLTRNIKFYGSASHLGTYVYAPADSINTAPYILFKNVEFYNFGLSTANKWGLVLNNNSGSINVLSCSFYNVGSSSYIFISNTNNTNNYTFGGNVGKNVVSFTNILANTATGFVSNWNVIDNCIVSSTNTLIHGTIDGNVIGNRLQCTAQFGSAIALSEIPASNTAPLGKIKDNVIKSCWGYGTFLSTGTRGIFENCHWIKNNGVNSSVGCAVLVADSTDITFRSCSFAGNVCTAGGAAIGVYRPNFNMTFDSCSFMSYQDYPQRIALQMQSPGNNAGCGGGSYVFTNCTLSSSVRDFDLLKATKTNIYLDNCNILGSTLVNDLTGDNRTTAVDNESFVIGGTIAYRKFGKIQKDTTIYYNTNSSSIRLTPNSSGSYLPSYVGSNNLYFDSRGKYKLAVSSSQTGSVSVYVRQSIIGDGTAYNGLPPRLIVEKNNPMGITENIVLNTATGVSGSWEQLTGSTMAVSASGILNFYVECGSGSYSAGWVNVDNWLGTNVNNTQTNGFYDIGMPFLVSNNFPSGSTTSGSGGGEHSYIFM